MSKLTPIEISAEEHDLLRRLASNLGHVQGSGAYLDERERGRAGLLISELLHGEPDLSMAFYVGEQPVTKAELRAELAELRAEFAKALKTWECWTTGDRSKPESGIKDRARIAELRARFLK